MLTKLTVEQRIERCHVQLMKDKNFCLFSGIFMIGKVRVLDNPYLTAGTDGRDVWYGREFMEGLNDKQINFVILHEAMHKAYRHLSVWKRLSDEDAGRANAAMDYVINLQIMDSDPNNLVVEFPVDANGNTIGLYDESFRGMDTKQVFDALKQGTCPKRQSDDPSERRGGRGKQHDQHDWENAKQMEDKEKEELSRDIDHALREGAILAGKMKGKIPRSIDELLNPKVDWRSALREFLKSAMLGRDQTSWRRPSRKFIGMDIIMPMMISEKAHCFVTGIDTSGSIFGEILTQFVSEVNSICTEINPEVMEVLYWDSHVAKHETYKDAEVQNFSTSTKPIGGGGTNPDCVPKYLKDKQINPQAIVMLTDGEFFKHNADDWAGSPPVLWCVIGNKNFQPKVGSVVYVE